MPQGAANAAHVARRARARHTRHVRRWGSSPCPHSTFARATVDKPFIARRNRNVGPVRDYPVNATIQQAQDVGAFVDHPHLHDMALAMHVLQERPEPPRACGRLSQAPGMPPTPAPSSTAIGTHDRCSDQRASSCEVLVVTSGNSARIASIELWWKDQHRCGQPRLPSRSIRQRHAPVPAARPSFR